MGNADMSPHGSAGPGLCGDFAGRFGWGLVSRARRGISAPRPRLAPDCPAGTARTEADQPVYSDSDLDHGAADLVVFPSRRIEGDLYRRMKRVSFIIPLYEYD